ncbi:hypothetical protein [Agilicoccus flavus]|uniref:hypothetical protein n=1 Tax=Agilicoccus flavus TaxID=2775968 RepID=UPI001CF64DBC|nr:hypothetical protein [Agilicoccus flavus]
MRRVVEVLFWATLVAFLVLGLLIVLGQAAGVVLGSGSLVAGTAGLLDAPAFSCATACAVAAFVLAYLDGPSQPEEPEQSGQGAAAR